MKLVSDIAGGAGDLGGRVRRGFGGFARRGSPAGRPTGQRPSDPRTATADEDAAADRDHAAVDGRAT